MAAFTATDIALDNDKGFWSVNEGPPQRFLDQFSREMLRAGAVLSVDSTYGFDIDLSYPTDPGNYTKIDGKRDIGWIVIHYTGGLGSARANAAYYASKGGLLASAHYFVGWASELGRIYRGVPENCRAWHSALLDYWRCEARNHNSIGIEVACHNSIPGEEKDASSLGWFFDPETIESLTRLVQALMKKYNIPADHVVRHFDVTGKLCPAMWVHDEAAWLKFKAGLTGEDTDMTKDEIKQVFKEAYDEENPLVKTIDDVPSYWKTEVQALLDKGVINGGTDAAVNPADINLRLETLKAVIIAARPR